MVQSQVWASMCLSPFYKDTAFYPDLCIHCARPQGPAPRNINACEGSSLELLCFSQRVAPTDEIVCCTPNDIGEVKMSLYVAKYFQPRFIHDERDIKKLCEMMSSVVSKRDKTRT